MGKNIIAEDIYEAKNGIEYDNSNIYKGKSFSDRLENENRKKINEAIINMNAKKRRISCR